MSDLGYINNWYGMGDNAILKQIANFIKQTRLKKNITQTNLAEKAGLHVLTSVTKKCDLLVLADPHSQSAKAKRARQYGIRIIHEPVFWKTIDVHVD